MNKSIIKVDARGGLGVPQEFAGMVGLAGGGHLYAANMPQQESKFIQNKWTPTIRLLIPFCFRCVNA